MKLYNYAPYLEDATISTATRRKIRFTFTHGAQVEIETWEVDLGGTIYFIVGAMDKHSTVTIEKTDMSKVLIKLSELICAEYI